MSDVLNRLKKKRAYPVTIDGDTFHVRPLTIGELMRLDVIERDQKTGFLLGCALCRDSSGEQEIPQNENESDADWSKRVLQLIADVPTETVRALSEGVATVGRTPNIEAVAKNSPGTQPPA